MPTRYLKPGIRDSEAIDKVSPLAETMFYRLLVTVDDFGRADARPAMVKAACFPIKESVTPAMCAELLAELATAGLLVVYAVANKSCMQLSKWDNAPRARESKFPAPSDVSAQTAEVRAQLQEAPAHLHTDVCNPRTVLPGTGTGTGTGTENREPETENRVGIPAQVCAVPAADAPATRGTRLAADWVLPKAWGEWTLSEFPHWTAEAIRLEADKFADFWRSKSGKDATKTDWQATWRNWCRNARQAAPPARASPDVAAGAARLLGFPPPQTSQAEILSA